MIKQAKENFTSAMAKRDTEGSEKLIALALAQDESVLEAMEKHTVLVVAGTTNAYLAEALQRKKLLLLGSLPQQKVADLLPSLDEELLLRAAETFDSGNSRKALHLLEAMDDHSTPGWYLLRGKIRLHLQQWSEATTHLHQAEVSFPKECMPLLEICYRELGNFQKAYEYACKQKQ